MERSSWVRRVTLLQFATIVAILALVTMHTPAVSHAMPTGHGARATVSANHMNGSACRTIQDQAATTPAAAEDLGPSPVVSAEPPSQLNDHPFRSLDQSTLSIWRT
jgi:hypothetical protein